MTILAQRALISLLHKHFNVHWSSSAHWSRFAVNTSTRTNLPFCHNAQVSLGVHNLDKNNLDIDNNSDNSNTRADNMDNARPSLESSQLEHKDDYQPLLPEASMDTTSSITLNTSDSPGGEVFTGRAISAVNTMASSWNAGAAPSHQSTGTQAENTSKAAPAAPTTPPHFKHNRRVSLLSRGFASSDPDAADMPSSDEAFSDDGDDGSPRQPNFTRRDFVPDQSPFESPSSNCDGRPRPGVLTTVFPWMGDRTRGNHQNAMAPLIEEVEVTSLDREYTLVAIDGVPYKVPNSELWLYSYDKENIMDPDEIASEIRESFFMSIWNQGASEAIGDVNGRRLYHISPTLSSQAVDTTSDFSEGHNSALESRDVDSGLDPRPSHCKHQVFQRILKIGLLIVYLAPFQSDSPIADTTNEAEAGLGSYEEMIEDLKKFGNFIRAVLSSFSVPTSSGNTLPVGAPVQLLTRDDVEQTLDIVNLLMTNETTAFAIEWKVLVQSRFDKLLEDILREAVDPGHPLHRLRDNCQTLQQTWMLRFGLDYSQIDEYRFDHLVTHALHGMHLTVDPENRWHKWRIQLATTPVEDAELVPGQYVHPFPIQILEC